MSFPKYPKYKASGVEWLGEVPEHWQVKKIGHLADLITGFAFPSEGFSFADSESTIPLVRGESVSEGYLRWGERGRYWPKESPYDERYLLDVDDIVVQMDGSKVGKNWAIVTEGDLPLLLVQRVTRIRCREVNPKFAFSLIANEMFVRYVDQAKTDPAVPHITMRNISDYWIPVPPPAEQTAIANFLDSETARIDALIAEQRRLIELLKEKRQAVISHAVTKGLNPNAPMKPSGIDWLGDVPEHWVIGPVKRFFTSLDGRRIPLSSEERSNRSGDFAYYGASGIIDWIDEYIFDEGLVLVSEDGANLLNRSTPISFVAMGKYWVNNHAHILKPQDDNLHFWAERVETMDLVPFVTGSAQPKLTAEALNNLMIAVPPTVDERATIERYFVKETTILDRLTTEAERAIDLLQERRTALISAAVTGKIDVREFANVEAA